MTRSYVSQSSCVPPAAVKMSRRRTRRRSASTPGSGSSGPASWTGPSTVTHAQPLRNVSVARGRARRFARLRAPWLTNATTRAPVTGCSITPALTSEACTDPSARAVATTARWWSPAPIRCTSSSVAMTLTLLVIGESQQPLRQVGRERDDLADDEDRRGAESRRRGRLRDAGQRRHDLALRGGGPRHDDGPRRVPGPAGVEQLAAQVGQTARRHQHDDRVRPELVPADRGLRVTAVPRHDRERGGDSPVRDRDAGRCGSREGGAEAGDDLVRDAERRQSPQLLAAPPEHERIAALEPDHDLVRPAAPRHPVHDALRIPTTFPGPGLRPGPVAGAVSDVDELRPGPDEREHR